MDGEVLVKTLFGSHLYGTNTPESDTDYKGIFMPRWRDILLGKVPKSVREGITDSTKKNTKDDIDSEVYSLHYFIKLATQGETVAIDMLHAPEHAIIESSWVWNELQSFRSKFYTKDLRSLVGYARKQAGKYGVKGSRLADAKRVLRFLSERDPETRFSEVWDNLPEGEHIRKTEEYYDVCGRKLIKTAKIQHYLPTVQNFVEKYGHRATLAEKNEGIDWKAISHAFRAGYQVQGILKDGDFDYPLPQAEFLKKVKLGEIHYKEAAPMLENLIDECEVLSSKSSLPPKVDQAWWDNWLADTISYYYL